MLRKVAIAAALGMSGMFGAAQSTIAAPIIGFTGPFAPAAWSATFTGTPAGGGGASTVQSATTLTINGGDSAGGCTTHPCLVNIVTNVGNFELISFHWAYHTNDLDGPEFDAFGYLVNNVFTQLSDPGGPLNQQGVLALKVPIGSVFGWRVDCDLGGIGNCIGGNAVATIDQFVAATPEPGSLALLGLGLAGFAALKRRREARPGV